MEQTQLKFELIEWVTNLDDQNILHYLKELKDSANNNKDWWEDLTDRQMQGIKRGIRDIDKGNVTPHEEVKLKYRL